jgi:hypothetical protein
MIYVYCVTDRKPDLEESAFGRCGNGIYAIGHGGLFAVVDRVSAEEFDEAHINERMEDTDWLKSKILEHEATVERIMLGGPLLPFKFATVFESEENVVKMLDENNAAFSTVIEGFRGKEEWGVRVYVDIEPLRRSLIDGDEEVGSLDRDIRSAAPGRAYILKKKREDLIGALAGRTMYEYGELCFEALKARSGMVRTNRLLPREITERKDEMILNAVFLVKREQMEVFRDTLEGLRAKYGPAGFSFDLTGPWPPYNFCSSTMDDIV